MCVCVFVCPFLQSRRGDGGVKVFDDFREAYAWLSHNTGARVLVATSQQHLRALPWPVVKRGGARVRLEHAT